MTILLCTSLRPSPRTRTFCNDLVAVAVEFEYYVRGKTSLLLLSAHAHSSGADRLWIVSSRFGDPKLIECFDTTGPKPRQLLSLLMNKVILIRELKVAQKRMLEKERSQSEDSDAPDYGDDRGRAPTQGGRRGHLSLRTPAGRSFSELHDCLLDSLGPLSYNRVPGEPETNLVVSPCKDCLAELTFVDSKSGALCGPKIMLRDYRF